MSSAKNNPVMIPPPGRFHAAALNTILTTGALLRSAFYVSIVTL